MQSRLANWGCLLQPSRHESGRDRPDKSGPSAAEVNESLTGTVLPSQLLFRPRKGRSIDGELNLMAAVLFDAIVCYQQGRHSRSLEAHRQYLQTWYWIQSRSTTGPFTFENVCSALHLDAGAVRSKLSAPASAKQMLYVAKGRRRRPG